jgi:N-acetylmuramoyl-L-alanine amidase
MNTFNRLPHIESEFAANKYKYDKFADKLNALPITKIAQQNGWEGHYIKETTKKTKIVLHFTVGNIEGDVASLISQQRGTVSVPYLIARSGTIYNLFPDEYYAHHLGYTAINNGMKREDKCTIGIELSNYGPLIKVGDELRSVYDTTYCTIQDKDAYTKLDLPFRGYTYFAAFTHAQYKSLKDLLKLITEHHEIPYQFLPESKRYQVLDASTIQNYKGILSHVNYRKDKYDIGPAFEWQKITQ